MAVPKFQIPAYPMTDAGELLVDQPQMYTLQGARLTRTVSLGRKPPKPGRAALHMAQFVELKTATPDFIDYSPKAMASIRLVYGNAGANAEGDCVIASGEHGIGVWSGNDSDGPGCIVGTTSEALSEYHRIGGPQDNGLVITDALDDMVRNGLLCGGSRRKIDGWVAVPLTKGFFQWVIAALGSCRIGFNVPAEWINNAVEGAVWDTPRSFSFVGGHDVRLFGYNSTGVIAATWGLKVTITWAALLNPRIVDEAYVELSPLAYGPDGKTPSGFDVATLKADLAMVSSGQMPSWIDPAPPSPPVPPTPPVPPVPPIPPVPPTKMTGFTTPTTVTIVVPNGRFGTTTVHVPIPALAVNVSSDGGFRLDEPAGAIPWLQIITIVTKVIPIVIADVQAGKPIQQIIQDVINALVSTHGSELRTLTPAQWQAIIALILKLLPIFIGG